MKLERAKSSTWRARRPIDGFQLATALRVVVVQHEAGDVFHRVLGRHVLRARADHQRQLDLPVGLVAAHRQAQVVVGTGQRARSLQEHDDASGEEVLQGR